MGGSTRGIKDATRLGGSTDLCIPILYAMFINNRQFISSRRSSKLSLGRVIVVILVTPTCLRSVLATNFAECIKRINNGDFGDTGGTDNHGQPMNITNSTAITYSMCVSACGSGPEAFSWAVFSQEFSAWQLPYLALISQLPYGANDKLENLDSMFLSVGSPVLAAYSLVLTALNGRWITKRFLPFKSHPSAYTAVRVLSSLQQSPLRINGNHQLLEALVNLPENREWWWELLAWLNMTHSWSIASATSLLWVTTAYLFTVIDSFTNEGITTSVNYNGQGVGSIWLWLVPIVVGWLQISPKCDSKHLHEAIERANRSHAWISTPAGNRRAERGEEYAMYLSVAHPTSQNDESCSPPIFNYARIFAWVQAVEEVEEVFRLAVQQPSRSPPTPSSSVFVPMSPGTPTFETVTVDGMLAVPLQQRCPTGDTPSLGVTAPVIHVPMRKSRWGDGTWQRILVASCLALFLQWGTTGAAVIGVWYTPTIGLGCRSGAYILYGIISSVVWIVMLLSSILSHYSTTAESQSTLSTRVADLLSTFLRRLGKMAAICNGVGLLVTCLFQFGNFFNRCYCNSSVLYWGKRAAYNVIIFLEEDVTAMRNTWIGGVFLATGSALVFFVNVNLYINPPFPSPSPEHGN